MTSANPFYDFGTSVDVPNELNMSRELISILNVDASGAQIDNADKITFATSFPGYTYDDMASMEQVFESMDQKYSNMLEQLKSTNDLINISNYVGNVYESESSRISHLKKNSVNNVYKMRQQYMTTKYALAYNKFVSNLMIFTLGTFIVCAVLGCLAIWPAPDPKLNPTIAICAVVTIASIYLLLTGMFVHRVMERRKDDWSKFYFNTPLGK